MNRETERAVVSFFKRLLTGLNYKDAILHDNFDHILDMVFQEMEGLGFESTYPEGPLSMEDGEEVIAKINELADFIRDLSDKEIYEMAIAIYTA
jgi:hypothetical protein